MENERTGKRENAKKTATETQRHKENSAALWRFSRLLSRFPVFPFSPRGSGTFHERRGERSYIWIAFLASTPPARLVFCLLAAVGLLASMFFGVLPAHAWKAGTPNHLKCKPLPFYRVRADERERYQFNRLAMDAFTVRLIYFTPSNRPFRGEAPTQLDALIKETQDFYADQMAAHGFGRKTFAFEADGSGRAIVHHVDGLFPDSFYLGANTSRNVEAEIELQFSLRDNIYLVAVDVSDGLINGAGGVGGARGPNGGVAFVPASGQNFDFTTVAHELGHAFGLHHDFRDDAFIMSYGEHPNRLSACHAEFLNVSRFFNSAASYTSEAEPMVKITSPLEYAPGTSAVAIRFELTDPDGLYQAQFLPITTDFASGRNRAAAVGAPELQDCVKVNGQAVQIEFSYSRLAGADAHRLALGVVDAQGHAALKHFTVYSTTRAGRTLRVAQSGTADFSSISDALSAALPEDGIEIADSGVYDEVLQITGNGVSIRPATGQRPTIETAVTFGAIGITLEKLSFSDGVFVQDASTEIHIRGNVIEAVQSGVLVTTASTAWIEGNAIRNSESGVTIQEGSEATLTDNQIANHARNGVNVQGQSKATISNCQIVDNGGAPITVFASNVTIANNAIQRNSDPLFVQDGAEAVITRNEIADSVSTAVVILNATADISNNTISRSGEHGVAISGAVGQALLIGNTIEESNELGVLIIRSNIRAERNVIRRNGRGGVTAQDGSDLLLINNLISRSATSTGRGVELIGGSARLINNTIVFHDIGLAAFEQATRPRVSVANTLFHGNRIDVANFNQTAASSEIRHSLLNDNAFVGRNGNINGNPQFIDAASDDYHLQSDSPAVDAGDGSVADLPEFDLDGAPRISGARVDIGAYEFTGAAPAFYEFELEFPAGVSLRHLPLAVTHVNDQSQPIQRVSDLYNALGGVMNVYQLLIYDNQAQKFRSFSAFDVAQARSLDAISSNISIGAHTGLIVIMKRAVVLTLRGEALSTTVPLTPGLNLVGLPRRDVGLERVSDLATIQGLSGNVNRILTHDGTRFSTANAPIVGGEAYIIDVRQPASLEIGGGAWDNTP